MKKVYYIFLFVLPIVLVLSAAFLNEARGPFWLGSNLDPEYVYLLNSLNLASLKGVGHIDHPGTPLQILGAITLKVVHFFQASENVDLHTKVLNQPEYYLGAINIVLVTLNAIMLLSLGMFTFFLTQNFWFSLWLQLSPFFSITSLQFSLTRVTPEPLLFFSSLMMTVFLVLKAYSKDFNVKNSTQSENIMLVSIFALITGFGIACKVTFIPLMVIPLIIFPKLKSKVFYLLAVGISFIIFTLPIIRMYPRFFDWVYKLLSHSGRYGSGAWRVIDSKLFMKNIKQLLTGSPFFSIILVLGLTIVIISLVTPKLRKISSSNIHFKLLAATTAAQVLGLFMVSKHSADHYLLPVLNLSGITLLLIFLYLKYILGPHKINSNILTILIVIFLVFLIVFINPAGQIKKSVNQLTKQKEASLAIRQEVENNYKDYVKIYYYRSSSLEYALKFGNDLSRSYSSEILQRLYKNVYFYDIWRKEFCGFDYNHVIPFSQIRAQHGNRIVFQGSREVKIPGIQLRRLTDFHFSEDIFAAE
ncbi:MAG: hypothetical protein JSV96_17675 [Candidatus Aminicenantes bacterium]|nr:MAG: hypothetical protein JSV96_17675 [Candidatus Aminicenantes bacterium]